MEPIVENRRPTEEGNGVQVLPSEILLYRPRPEDWGGNLKSECDRISAGLSQLMNWATAKPFVSPVERNGYPSSASIVEYPMDLSTIKARLDNCFYRRASAVEFDVNYIFTNACKFNQPESDMVRFALIITKACIKIIRNSTAVSQYEMRVGGADDAASGPSTSRSDAKRSGTNPNIRPESRRNWHTEFESQDPSEPKSRVFKFLLTPSSILSR